MRIVILTSLRKGTASYFVPVLKEKARAEIVQVIYCQPVVRSKSRYYRQKLRKVWKIGIGGALNGIRMRKWFSVQEIDGRSLEDIEAVCKKNDVPFTVAEGINSAQTAEKMRACQADLGLSLGNSYIASKIFSIPRYGMLNLHGEVLPQFQNAQSVIWQLFEGSDHTGYTIHQIDKKIDTGDILKQEIIPIQFRDTLGGTVAASCAEILKRSALGLAEVINHFDRCRQEKKTQGTGKSYTTPSLGQFIRIYSNYKKLKKSHVRDIGNTNKV